jgi:hypothetical protein
MSDYSTAFQVACIPGPESAVAVARLVGGTLGLVVYLDPVNITIHCPPARTRELADFCRALAQEASHLAAEIDPDGEPAPPEASTPRHALVRNELGESGGGH